VSQAATADLPAVTPSGPRQMVSVSWLAITAATATRMNLLNLLPTLVWSLLFTAALIRDGPNVMRRPRPGEAGFAATDCVKLRKPC
jgi:hypothetical protein